MTGTSHLYTYEWWACIILHHHFFSSLSCFIFVWLEQRLIQQQQRCWWWWTFVIIIDHRNKKQKITILYINVFGFDVHWATRVCVCVKRENPNTEWNVLLMCLVCFINDKKRDIIIKLVNNNHNGNFNHRWNHQNIYYIQF